MFDSLTEKLLIIAGAFLLAAGLAATAAYVIPEAYADAKTEQVQQPAPKQTAKGSSAADRNIAACSAKSWPYYDAHCLVQDRANGKDAKPVRIIAVR
ncbi:MAG TPA: hypothetical protein VM867_13650 [Xanthobacteraceae bacterium]|nr:hypothetical protein [Xanthobacteraceae bacterium]